MCGRHTIAALLRGTGIIICVSGYLKKLAEEVLKKLESNLSPDNVSSSRPLGGALLRGGNDARLLGRGLLSGDGRSQYSYFLGVLEI